MSTRFLDSAFGAVAIIPPNTEAIVSCQRFGNKPRTVCGYYVSGKSESLLKFFDYFHGKCIIDLPLSISLCSDFLAVLIQNCSSFYIDGLRSLNCALDFLKNELKERKEQDLIFQCFVYLTETQKYLKINSDSGYFPFFKNLILGDLIEIIFKRIDSVYLVYLRPRINDLSIISSNSAFKKWLNENIRK
ncbi:MAG TPA: hypothetical protein DD377_03945 [Firmicutes bacterium]|nr:hypothetical protein [Bacillota bacterium]